MVQNPCSTPPIWTSEGVKGGLIRFYHEIAGVGLVFPRADESTRVVSVAPAQIVEEREGPFKFFTMCTGATVATQMWQPAPLGISFQAWASLCSQ